MTTSSITNCAPLQVSAFPPDETGGAGGVRRRESWGSAFDSADGLVEPKPYQPDAGRAFWGSDFGSQPDGASWTTFFDELVRQGILLPDAIHLSDTEINTLIPKMAAALATMNVFLRHTDHLTDRELYVFLTTEALREDRLIAPVCRSERPCILDLVGGMCGREAYLFLKHYATPTERAQWLVENPGYVMPLHEDPACRRDAMLPQS